MTVVRRIQVDEEGHEAAHVVERHHRGAVAYQSIVGIVPLRAQGVHPYTCLWNEIAEFGEQCDKQFLGESHEQRLLVNTHHKACILSVGWQLFEDMFVGCLVKSDGVLRVAHNVAIRLEAIRHIGKRELAHAQ